MRLELKEKIHKIPQKCGIYLMRNELGEVIYVGKAVRLRSRLLSHFRDLKGSPKSEAMIEAVRDIDFIVLKSPQEALILECQYIKEFKPKYNVSYRDDKTYPLLKVTFNESFPRFMITRTKKPDGALYLGPYTNSQALRKTVEQLQKIFKIRTCNLVDPRKPDYDHCLYQMMKWCSAPCVGNISKEDYRQSVDHACQVLLGRSQELVFKMKKQIEEASKNLDFEKAAQLRDRMRAIENIAGTRMNTLRNFKRISSHAVQEMQSLAEVLGLENPPIRMEAFDISNFSGKEAVGSMVHFFQGAPDKRFYRRFRIKSVLGIDDFAMMKEVVGRRYRGLKEEGGVFPDLILIDGGKGQLSSAFSVLQEMGLTALPVIGLAKRYEEIYRPFSNEPLRLAKDSGALHLIQRIRDEAHRFAVTYHKILREKKLKESILDDISGVGLVKRAELLKHFGSIGEMKKASMDELQKATGISRKLADKIYKVLHHH